MAVLVGRLSARPDRTPVYTPDEAVSHLLAMEKILECQMRPMASNRPVPKQVFVNQYLVKWKGFSYLHCSWVPEHEFEKAYKSLRGLETMVNQFHSTMESLGNKVYDFVAIPPEWTTVDRIISFREEDGQRKYLVKFKGLSYAECYWESESDISTFQNEFRRFFDINFGNRRGMYVDHERNHEGFKQITSLTPKFITGSLQPYHLEGLNFLRSAWSNRTHVVLADNMWLGTRIQSIAFLASLFAENVAPFLVVAPSSTLRNWEIGFTTWAPQMNVVVYGGTSQARTVIIQHEFYLPRGRMNGVRGETNRIKFDVILTSYEILDVDTAVLKPIKWKCTIVDDGHRLENENPKLFYSLKQFTCEHHILLTGRPLQVVNSEQQAEQLSALGKRKRNRKQIVEKEAEPTDGEEARQGNKKTRWPYRRRTHRRKTHLCSGPRPLIEGQGKSLRVLGFRESQRKTFLDTLMRYGVGNYDWKEFVYPLMWKTYDEINNYGNFFLELIIKDTQDTNPPTFSDMVPKIGLTRDKVLARITVMMLLQEKVKLIENHPSKTVFPDPIIGRFAALKNERNWNKEHDKLLLRAVSKHGFGKWIDIVKDKEFELEQLICKALKVPVENLTRTNPDQKDPHRQLADYLRKRFEILENAMSDECADTYYRNGRRPDEHPLLDIAIADIRRRVSVM
ncbi:CHD3-type chromatin-remodeling factor PICKLE-like [Brassica rapa]|uniref:CHD3-type chromatin-remodeling factor PICKLE-like n=1 Tax=Brassica campestris TaxID=3711 RepID=UPI0004F175E3|nr:CHD3-type chromatin-remodeling factor PICKLE-like [Brassica rapa]XP_033144321.1 CHD3-type chromatin-remodeling factor PICKLE-like [Brassica rapa]